jgi:hypothetical protein
MVGESTESRKITWEITRNDVTARPDTPHRPRKVINSEKSDITGAIQKSQKLEIL